MILERQQRLTEEFVPRADLVLFVLSADRPMTESEVKFLSYIRKWGKKVIFVVNKCDRLENADEVEAGLHSLLGVRTVVRTVVTPGCQIGVTWTVPAVPAAIS